jgi:hypothetical protein
MSARAAAESLPCSGAIVNPILDSSCKQEVLSILEPDQPGGVHFAHPQQVHGRN